MNLELHSKVRTKLGLGYKVKKHLNKPSTFMYKWISFLQANIVMTYKYR